VVDQIVVETANYSPSECAETTFTQEELNANLRKAITTNEDVGRYIGYGRKDISKG